MTPPLHRNARWIGAAAGLLLGAFDIAVATWFGITFEISGRDATPLVWVYLSGSFGALGFFLGHVLDARRNERAAAAALAEAQARLAQKEKLATLGQLAAAIAHEVRNPLAIIRSSVQNLAESLSGADDARESCTFVIEEIDRLTKVTSSLLGFSRPLVVRPAPVAISELFDRTELLARALLVKKSLKLSRDAAPGVVDGDPDLLCQALLGLISNAADVLPEGGEVTLEARAGDRTIELAVADSGPGVPPELRARIFEPFFTTRREGHGLGLAVVRQIAEAHGGRVDVGDRPGGGARFTLTLERRAA